MSSQIPPVDPGNPYAAPSARIDDLEVPVANELASRSARLGAALLDGAIFIAAMVLVAIVVPFLARSGADRTATVGVIGIVMAVSMLAWVVVTLVFVFRYQQTIGKRICRIKVVRSDGSPCNPWRIVLLRGVVTGFLDNIPLVGPLFGLIDPLLIFREDRRCIHDFIADTIVVRA